MNIEKIHATDFITGREIPLHDILLEMERRIDRLEEENAATTNNLYELMNELDELKRKVDT